MSKIKKNDLIKAKKLCNIFRVIGDPNSINYGEEFETDSCNINPEDLEQGKKILTNTRKVFGLRYQN